MRLVLDAETYYDNEYSLKKMHTLEYVRDERFLLHGVAVKIDEEPTYWVPGYTLNSFIDSIRDKEVELVCHNMYFDGLVLYHHYDYVPTVYSDTLSMSRALLPHAPKHELDFLCESLHIGNKIPEVLGLTKGLRVLTPQLSEQLAEYAINDVELTYALWERLHPGLPDDELALIDLTMRWGCRPVLHVDLERAGMALREAHKFRNSKIAESGEPLEVLSSQPKFTAALEARGIEVPMKTNKKGKQIPALAKNDLGFRALLVDYPEHKALLQGRMAAKSTIDVTRTQRVIDIGSRGTLPMPLKYYGAHTGRWSGHDGLNPQNFRRKSELRKSIIAPPGYVILVADQKQIELRINVWFCKEAEWLQILVDGIDVYTAAAADHCNIPLSEVTGDQRFFGKTIELGLGYQCGWSKFRTICALKDIVLTEEQAYEAVSHYRHTHPGIRNKWTMLSGQLNGMYNEHYAHYDGPVCYVHEGILLPNGMRLDYSGLTPHENGNWTYGYGDKIKFIYGGKMLENIVQALARIVIGQQMLAIEDAGITTVSSTHDEILMVVREAEADEALETVTRLMRIPPDWAPDLPLDVEIGYDRMYSK